MLLPSVALALVSSCCPQQPEPVQLRHALTPDSRFAFVVEVAATIELDDDPRGKGNSRMRFLLHFAATVGPRVHEHAAVACRLARIEADIRSPAARVNYDSDSTVDAGALSQLVQLVDQSFTVHVDGRGHIESVLVPPALSAIARERLGAEFDSLFAAYFVSFPATSMAIGDGWDSELSLVAPVLAGANTVQVANRLLGVADGRATIGRTLHLPPPPARADVKFAVQKAAGTAVFDLQSGRVITAELELIAHAVRTEPAGHDQASSGTSTLRIRAATEKEAAPRPAKPPLDR